MTNQVAEAIALCEEEIGFYNRQLEIYPKDSAPYNRHLVLRNSWLAHQSFFKRHEMVPADEFGNYNLAERPYIDACRRCETAYPCPEAVTTADLIVNGVEE